MKKYFSLIALVGVFAACQPENLTTAFEVAPAEVTITAKVVDILTGEDVTAAATITSETTLVGTPALAAQDYTVSATYKEGKGSATIHINALRAGGKANYNVIIPVPGDILDYEIDADFEKVGEKTDYLYLAGADMHYDGSFWAQNASEFILKDSCTYPDWEGTWTFDEESAELLEPSFESDAVIWLSAFYDEQTEVEKTFDFSASAWSLYQVVCAVTTTEYLIKITATPKPGTDAHVVGDNGVIATAKAVAKQSAIDSDECAHPDHASHYIYHHGHGEKPGPNAGGGLVEAE